MSGSRCSVSGSSWYSSTWPFRRCTTCLAIGCRLSGDRSAVGVRDRVSVGDRDLARFGFLGDRDAQREDTGAVAGLHPVGVRGVAENQLPPEQPSRAFGGDHLGVLAGRLATLGPHG